MANRLANFIDTQIQKRTERTKQRIAPFMQALNQYTQYKQNEKVKTQTLDYYTKEAKNIGIPEEEWAEVVKNTPYNQLGSRFNDLKSKSELLRTYDFQGIETTGDTLDDRLKNAKELEKQKMWDYYHKTATDAGIPENEWEKIKKETPYGNLPAALNSTITKYKRLKQFEDSGYELPENMKEKSIDEKLRYLETQATKTELKRDAIKRRNKITKYDFTGNKITLYRDPLTSKVYSADGNVVDINKYSDAAPQTKTVYDKNNNKVTLISRDGRYYTKEGNLVDQADYTLNSNPFLEIEKDTQEAVFKGKAVKLQNLKGELDKLTAAIDKAKQDGVKSFKRIPVEIWDAKAKKYVTKKMAYSSVKKRKMKLQDTINKKEAEINKKTTSWRKKNTLGSGTGATRQEKNKPNTPEGLRPIGETKDGTMIYRNAEGKYCLKDGTPVEIVGDNKQ